MGKTKILIATSNEGKFHEISSYFSTLPFLEFVSLHSLPPILPPEEPGKTIEENALIKARYYAEKTGMVSLADDSGLFIEELHGWPGVDTSLQGKTDEERLNNVMKKAESIPKEKRQAYFASCIIVYDPKTHAWHCVREITQGELLSEPVSERTHGLPFDSVFFDTTAKKINVHMTVEEKNIHSHRGKALEKIKYYLRDTFASRHVVVPFALIVQEGKILMSLRNDPHQTDAHHKWEFPGGTVEEGETMHGNVAREVEEETGLKVEPVRLLQHIGVELMPKQSSSVIYQVFLVPYLCRVVGGTLQLSDTEVIEARWFDPSDVLNHELLGTNAEVYAQLYPEIQSLL